MNTHKRKIRALQVVANEIFQEDLDSLAECLSSRSPELHRSLLMRIWTFWKDTGIIPGDLIFPLDLLPDKQAAREALAKFDHFAFNRLPAELEASPAKRRRYDLHSIDFIQAIRTWLDENPQAARLWETVRQQ